MSRTHISPRSRYQISRRFLRLARDWRRLDARYASARPGPAARWPYPRRRGYGRHGPSEATI